MFTDVLQSHYFCLCMHAQSHGRWMISRKNYSSPPGHRHSLDMLEILTLYSSQSRHNPMQSGMELHSSQSNFNVTCRSSQPNSSRSRDSEDIQSHSDDLLLPLRYYLWCSAEAIDQSCGSSRLGISHLGRLLVAD